MPGSDLDLLYRVAEEAGQIGLKYFRKSPATWEKSDGLGPVTEADIAINQLLVERLQSARPDYGWLSEESEDDPIRLQKHRTFIVDPIDGTRAFIAGHENYAHALAIAEKGQITDAVIHLPSAGKTFWASRGKGAYLNGELLKVGPTTKHQPPQLLAAKPQLKPELWPGGVPQMEVHFRSSLAYRICLIAEGAFDAMLTLRDCWEWDIAAGDLIAREAGARVTDRTGGRLKFNNPMRKQSGVLAARADVHLDLMNRL